MINVELKKHSLERLQKMKKNFDAKVPNKYYPLQIHKVLVFIT